MIGQQLVEQRNDGVADDDALTVKIAKGFECLLGRLLTHETRLREEALAAAQACKRQIVLRLGEPALGFGLSSLDGGRLLRAAPASREDSHPPPCG